MAKYRGIRQTPENVIDWVMTLAWEFYSDNKFGVPYPSESEIETVVDEYAKTHEYAKRARNHLLKDVKDCFTQRIENDRNFDLDNTVKEIFRHLDDIEDVQEDNLTDTVCEHLDAMVMTRYHGPALYKAVTDHIAKACSIYFFKGLGGRDAIKQPRDY